ncbi:MAG: serine/threonine-protein kinase, partial [Thermostichales cyanobacterium SRBZ-1_bins_19]
MLNTHLHQVIGERYTLTQILGEGAMGRVYLATDQMLGQVPVAIKVLSQSLPEEAMRQRFRQEALACAALGQKSLHIVRVTDFGITDWGSPFYVMEYLPGQTLRELIGQGLAPDRWKKIATQMLLGLQAAHEGVVIQGRTVQVIHRDLKPANVMVMPDPSLGELVKLVDFGVAIAVGGGAPGVPFLPSGGGELIYEMGVVALSGLGAGLTFPEI